MSLKLLTMKDISQSNLDNLSKKIKKANGKVIVLVHPFYYDGKPGKKYFETVYKLLNASKIPAILLEEAPYIKIQNIQSL